MERRGQHNIFLTMGSVSWLIRRARQAGSRHRSAEKGVEPIEVMSPLVVTVFNFVYMLVFGVHRKIGVLMQGRIGFELVVFDLGILV